VAVGNLGPSNADNVTVTDTLPPGFTFVSGSAMPSQGTCTNLPCNLGTIVPGTTATVSFLVNVAPSVAPGPKTNTGGAFSDEGELETDDETTEINERSSVTVVKTDSPDPVVAGSQVTYTMVVGNEGPSDADGVSLVDLLPPGFLATTTVSTPQGTCLGTNCSLGTIAPGSFVTVTLVADVSASHPDGVVTNTVIVDADESEAASDDEPTEVVTRADLVINKGDSPDPVLVGGQISYVLTVSNAGPSDAAGVQVTDTLPSGVIVTAVDSGCIDNADGTISCATALLPAGQSVQWTITVQVGKVDGTFVFDGAILQNEAEVGSVTVELVPGNNVVTAETTVSAPSVPLVKTATPPNGSDLSPGQTIEYTISYSNVGTVTATAVVVTDTVSPALGFITPNDGGEFDSSTRVVSWTVGDLGPGDSGSVSFSGTLGSALSREDVINRAFASIDEYLDLVASNQTLHFLQPPDVIITKGSDKGENTDVRAVELITYQLVVTNRGRGQVQNVIVQDTPPSIVNYVPGSTSLDGVSVPDSGGTSPLFGAGVVIPTLNSGQSRIVTFQARVDISVRPGTLVENFAEISWNLGASSAADFHRLFVIRALNAPLLRQSILVEGPSGSVLFITVFNEVLGRLVRVSSRGSVVQILPETGIGAILMLLLALAIAGLGRALSMRMPADLRRKSKQ
ncbi:MAG TPA: hypothetical protein VND22_07815, partial [Actinomycetota bacterium]|nr:hypothetical protein [Actinomycetota bacterium]